MHQDLCTRRSRWSQWKIGYKIRQANGKSSLCLLGKEVEEVQLTFVNTVVIISSVPFKEEFFNSIRIEIKERN